jgi:hypothetical protein
VAPVGTVPSPHFNNKLQIAAFLDLLPKVDRGSIVKVGLEWILFIVATRGRVALVALSVVVPPDPAPPPGD